MKLDREQVEHIANLARLELTEDEKVLYQEQLSTILEYFEKLRDLDTDAIPPTESVLSMSNVMRPDEPEASLTPEDVLRNAPDVQDGMFKIPPVFE